MITVNLLPYHLRPVKRTPLPYLLSFVVLLVSVGGVGWDFVSIQARIVACNHELSHVQAELNKLHNVIQEAQALQNKKKMLASKAATISEIVKGRIIWSKQLYELARLATPNMWYSAIKVEPKQFPEKKMVMNPHTKKAQMKTVMVKHSVLELAGYVVSTPDAPAELNPFLLKAESDKDFSNLFQQRTQSISDTKFDGAPVRRFKLEFEITAGAGI